MAHAMDELLNSSTLSEEVRSSISEAWDTQLTDNRQGRDTKQNRWKNSVKFQEI